MKRLIIFLLFIPFNVVAETVTTPTYEYYDFINSSLVYNSSQTAANGASAQLMEEHLLTFVTSPPTFTVPNCYTVTPNPPSFINTGTESISGTGSATGTKTLYQFSQDIRVYNETDSVCETTNPIQVHSASSFRNLISCTSGTYDTSSQLCVEGSAQGNDEICQTNPDLCQDIAKLNDIDTNTDDIESGINETNNWLSTINDVLTNLLPTVTEETPTLETPDEIDAQSIEDSLVEKITNNDAVSTSDMVSANTSLLSTVFPVTGSDYCPMVDYSINIFGNTYSITEPAIIICDAFRAFRVILDYLLGAIAIILIWKMMIGINSMRYN